MKAMRNKKIIRSGVCVVINSNRGFHQLVKKNDNFFCKRKIRGKQRLDSLPFKEKFIIIKHSLFENLIARLSDRFFVIDFFGLSRRMEETEAKRISLSMCVHVPTTFAEINNVLCSFL